MPDLLRRAAFLFGLLLAAWVSVPVTSQAQNGCANGGRLTPVAVGSDGIGGTGLKPDDPDEGGGIGGTGHSSDDADEGGIGGTGIRAEADTGIIGTITGFGSICVGDTEIHYDLDTPIVSDGGASGATLAIGQVVEVVAEGDGHELTARSIGIRRALRGPIVAVNLGENQFVALGQIVQLDEATWTGSPVDPRAAALADFEQGDFVEVSGLRRADGVIVASRITHVSADGGAFLSGSVSRLEGNDLFVGETRVEAAPEERASISTGDEVDLSGAWTGSSLHATSVTVAPSIPFGGRVKRIEIEGYVQGGMSERELRVGAFRVELSDQAGQADAAQAAFEAGEPIRVEAVVGPDRVLTHGRLLRVPRAPRASDRVVQPRGAMRADPANREGEGSSPPGAPEDGRGRGDAGAGPHSAPPPRQDSLHAGDSGGRPDRPEPPALERPDRPAPPERPERPQRPMRPDRPPRPDRPDRPPGR